jgi:folate-dependent phosphoribosylglycinamide formyltransferase PurN
MSATQIEEDRPIRVVMFGSGPELNPDAKQFLCRLEEHPEIELLGAFCQAQSQSWQAVFIDLWKRRRWLAFPLFAISMINKAVRFLLHPREEIALRRSLEKISDRIHFVSDIHAQNVLEQVSALNPDLGLIYGSPILKPELFERPRLGTLGIHHGKVPEYRGNKTTFWAMYNGERAAGVTIQKVNRGLDTGSIVKTGEVSTPGRAYQAVVHELEVLGLDLYIQAILEVKYGTAEYKPQSGGKGKLYRNPKPGDFLKFWGRQIRKRAGIAK